MHGEFESGWNSACEPRLWRSDRRRPAGIDLLKKAMDLRLSIFKARVFFGAGAN
jgi:hypothetical protein